MVKLVNGKCLFKTDVHCRSMRMLTTMGDVIINVN